MKDLANLFLLSIACLPYCNGDATLHHYDATQWDVMSPPGDRCETSAGFFGRMAKFEHKVKCQYELTLKRGGYLNEAFEPRAAGGTDPRPEGLQGVLGAVETGIADALLGSQVFNTACAAGQIRGPYKRGNGRQLLRNEERQLRAVGISSNPADEILEGREYQFCSIRRCRFPTTISNSFSLFCISFHVDSYLSFLCK